MPVIGGSPVMLEQVGGDLISGVTQREADIDAYGDAVLAYNTADSTLPASATSHRTLAHQSLEPITDAGEIAQSFGVALGMLSSLPMDQRGPNATFTTSNTRLVELLAEASRTHGTTDADELATILAGTYADRLSELSYEGPYPDYSGSDLPAEHDELVALFADIEMLSDWNPAFADELVDQLGGEGVVEVLHFIDGLTDRTRNDLSQELWEQVDWMETFAEPFVSIVETAARPGGVSQGVLDDLVEHASGGPMTLLLGLGTFDRDRFLDMAVQDVLEDKYVVNGGLAWELAEGDVISAALLGASRDSDYAWELLNDDRVVDMALFDNDRHAGSVDAFMQAAFAQGVDDPTVTAARLGELIDRINAEADRDGFLFTGIGEGQRLSDAARFALADVVNLHLGLIGEDVTPGSGTSSNLGLAATDLQAFITNLLDGDAAAERLAEGLGVYQAHAVALGAEQLTDAGAIEGSILDELGYLNGMFHVALDERFSEDADKVDFWISAGNAFAGIAVGVGLAAAGVTGGTSALVGGAANYTIGQLLDEIDVPSFNGPQNVLDRDEQIRYLSAFAVAQNSENFDGLTLTDDELATLNDPEFIESFFNGDRDALDEFDAIYGNTSNGLRTETRSFAQIVIDGSSNYQSG